MTTRHLVLAGAGLVGAATAATSAYSLYALAQLCGIPGPLAAALPIALDAGAAVAALVWITETGTLRRWGRAIAVTALLGTLAGNGVQHAITVGVLQTTLPLVLAVGAAIPASLWATVHLAALMVAAGREPAAPAVDTTADMSIFEPTTPKPATVTATAVAARAPTARTVSTPVRAVGSSVSARARTWIRAELDAGREPTGADVDTELGLTGKARCGARELRKVLAERERTA